MKKSKLIQAKEMGRNRRMKQGSPRRGADAERNCFHARASLLAAADEGVRRSARGGRAPQFLKEMPVVAGGDGGNREDYGDFLAMRQRSRGQAVPAPERPGCQISFSSGRFGVFYVALI